MVNNRTPVEPISISVNSHDTAYGYSHMRTTGMGYTYKMASLVLVPEQLSAASEAAIREELFKVEQELQAKRCSFRSRIGLPSKAEFVLDQRATQLGATLRSGSRVYRGQFNPSKLAELITPQVRDGLLDLHQTCGPGMFDKAIGTLIEQLEQDKEDARQRQIDEETAAINTAIGLPNPGA